jgi:hypothetical protein
MVEICPSKNLPMHIVYYILSYHHNPQSKPLRNDIVHFVHSRNYILERYEFIWREYAITPTEHLNYLENDIYRHSNNLVPSMYGYTEHFYKIFLRLPFVNPIKKHLYFGKNMYDDSDYTYKIFKYIRNLDSRVTENNDISKLKVNIIWGLLTIREREEFISMI